jgi:hypothetical protein
MTARDDDDGEVLTTEERDRLFIDAVVAIGKRINAPVPPNKPAVKRCGIYDAETMQ